jgi:hypothetical protein
MGKLKSDDVIRIYADCARAEGNETAKIFVDGIMHKHEFNPVQIEIHKQEIIDMIAELPEGFSDGGDSFLNLCNDKNGELWTGLHQVCEQLMVLGIAIGKIHILFSRDMWRMLPGGMPVLLISEERDG